MEEKTKVCSRCKIEKPLSDFHRRKRNKDGFSGVCKKCIDISGWRAANPEKCKQYSTERDKEKHKLAKKVWYLSNKEKGLFGITCGNPLRDSCTQGSKFGLTCGLG